MRSTASATSAPRGLDVVALGFKYNLTDVAAAIRVVQLSGRPCASRQRAAERYLRKLADLPLDCRQPHLPAAFMPGICFRYGSIRVRAPTAMT
jgi:dTDP-4-amino-4,6-dideoxygalactose transaminase